MTLHLGQQVVCERAAAHDEVVHLALHGGAAGERADQVVHTDELLLRMTARGVSDSTHNVTACRVTSKHTLTPTTHTRHTHNVAK